MYYTISEISEKCNVSKQSIYNLINKNKDFIQSHLKKEGRKIFYDDTVLQFFIEYYNESEHKEEINKEQNKEIENLKAKIKEAELEIEKLKKQLEESNEERKNLINQNGALILALTQEKQEKQLLLQAPKKTLKEKLQNLFKSNK